MSVRQNYKIRLKLCTLCLCENNENENYVIQRDTKLYLFLGKTKFIR